MRQNAYTENYVNGDAEERMVVVLNDPRPRFRRGGLVAAAQRVRRAGEIDDEVLVHLTKAEFNELQRAWGPPSINPRTGLPEYSLLKKIGKGLKRVAKSKLFQVVAPIAASIFLPGIGGLIAQSLIGAASSKAKGGNALLGALTGAAGHFIGGGNMVKGGAGPGTLSSLVSKIPTTPTGPTAAGVGASAGALGAEGVAAPALEGAIGAAAPAAAKTGMKGALSKIAQSPTMMKVGDTVVPALNKGLAMSSSTLGKIGTGLAMEGLRTSEAEYAKAMEAAEQGQDQQSDLSDTNFGDPLPQLDFNRKYVGMGDNAGYGRSGGEHSFFDANSLPSMVAQPEDDVGLKDGGGVRGPGTGRSDDIDARLSDGEYIFDAESVAMLGDGSVDAGARQLDDLRRRLRQHKGRALAKGKFSPDAKKPHEYLSRGGKVLKSLKGVPSGGAKRLTMQERLMQVEQARRMADAIREIQRGTPMKKAKGGKVRGPALRALINTANEFEQALSRGDQGQMVSLAGALDGHAPGASAAGSLAFARGGSVMAAIKKMIAMAEKEQQPPSLLRRRTDQVPLDQAYPNQPTDLSDIAAMLEQLNPKSGTLRQYKSDRDRRLMPRRTRYATEVE